jgi:methionine sulfoxide reductase heme-binding subunit
MALLAASGPTAYWYLARGTGVVSLLLLTAIVVLGVMGPLRVAAPRWPRFAIDGLHRDLSLLVMVVLVLHIATSVLDGFAPITWLNAVIPIGATYRPLWLGLGALSFDLLLALVITSLVRRRLGYRSWRAIHWAAYASWPVAVAHGLGTGTDASSTWMLLITAVCLAAVVVAVAMRIARADVPGVRAPALAVTILTPLALVILAIAGPLAPGWARRAGTPASLLSHSTSARVSARVPAKSASAPAARPAPSTLKLPFSASLNGSINQTEEPGGAIIDLAMQLSGGTNGELRVRMAGSPDGNGGLSLTGSQVDLAPTGVSPVLQGKIVSLQGQAFLARVRGQGPAVDLQVNLNINDQSGTVTGTVSGTRTGGGA